MKRKNNKSKKIHYIETVFSKESSLLSSVRSYCDDHKWGMHIDPHEGKLLRMLISLHQPKHILEIGTLGGYSALWIAEGMPKDATVTTIEIDPVRATAARAHFESSPYSSQISLIEGDAQDVLTTMPPGIKFDCVFIDANKSSYLDYMHWAEAHLTPRGMIIMDNAYLFDAVFEDELPQGVTAASRDKMKECHHYLAESSSYDTTMIPTEQGMLIAIKTQ